jgi:hypothetical protein
MRSSTSPFLFIEHVVPHLRLSVVYLMVHFRWHCIPPPLISSAICIMGKVDLDYPLENSDGTLNLQSKMFQRLLRSSILFTRLYGGMSLQRRTKSN